MAFFMFLLFIYLLLLMNPRIQSLLDPTSINADPMFVDVY